MIADPRDARILARARVHPNQQVALDALALPLARCLPGQPDLLHALTDALLGCMAASELDPAYITVLTTPICDALRHVAGGSALSGTEAG